MVYSNNVTSAACPRCGGFGLAHYLSCPKLRLPQGFKIITYPTLAEVIAQEGIKDSERLAAEELFLLES